MTSGERQVPEETAVAFTYNGSSHAVMMATPQDLRDFAVGFTLSEEIVSSADQIDEIEFLTLEDGIEARISVAQSQRLAFERRRRHLAGPTGCGLCGLESLSEAMRPLHRVTADLSLTADSIVSALKLVSGQQELNHQARALHAAAFCQPDRGPIVVREDVGRHNAVDKLFGAMVRLSEPAETGFVLITSRVSIEIVQKVSTMGAPVLVAVSAPTALAVRACETAGITLVATARSDGFEVFTHAERLAGGRLRREAF